MFKMPVSYRRHNSAAWLLALGKLRESAVLPHNPSQETIRTHPLEPAAQSDTVRRKSPWITSVQLSDAIHAIKDGTGLRPRHNVKIWNDGSVTDDQDVWLGNIYDEI
jgi:hypothetical protein